MLTLLTLLACTRTEPDTASDTEPPAANDTEQGTACDSGPGAYDDGTAAYSCTYTYTFNIGTETGVYADETLTCEDYTLGGDQVLGSQEFHCEEAGIARGATETSCTCGPFSLSPECRPCVTND